MKHSDVMLDATTLHVGETSYKFICPSCGSGGGSFSVTRTRLGAMYHCFRAKCGKGGRIGPKGEREDYAKPPFHPSPYLGALSSVNERIYGHIWNTYGISPSVMEANGVLYAADINSLAIPIRNACMEQVGICTKALPKEFSRTGIVAVPKSRLYMTTQHPKLFFPKQDMYRKGEVVIVEDALSAIRVSRYTRAAFIAGTHMSTEAALMLRGVTSSVKVALDPDTWVPPPGNSNFLPAPLRMKQQIGLMFKRVSVVLPVKDPKDYKTEFELVRDLKLSTEL